MYLDHLGIARSWTIGARSRTNGARCPTTGARSLTTRARSRTQRKKLDHSCQPPSPNSTELSPNLTEKQLPFTLKVIPDLNILKNLVVRVVYVQKIHYTMTVWRASESFPSASSKLLMCRLHTMD